MCWSISTFGGGWPGCCPPIFEEVIEQAYDFNLDGQRDLLVQQAVMVKQH